MNIHWAVSVQSVQVNQDSYVLDENSKFKMKTSRNKRKRKCEEKCIGKVRTETALRPVVKAGYENNGFLGVNI